MSLVAKVTILEQSLKNERNEKLAAQQALQVAEAQVTTLMRPVVTSFDRMSVDEVEDCNATQRDARPVGSTRTSSLQKRVRAQYDSGDGGVEKETMMDTHQQDVPTNTMNSGCLPKQARGSDGVDGPLWREGGGDITSSSVASKFRRVFSVFSPGTSSNSLESDKTGAQSVSDDIGCSAEFSQSRLRSSTTSLGSWNMGVQAGQGELVSGEGDVYTGGWVSGRPEGFGKK
eukprot:gene42677-52942_t